MRSGRNGTQIIIQNNLENIDNIQYFHTCKFQCYFLSNMVKEHQIVNLYFQRNADAIKENDSRYCFTIENNILHNNEDAEACVNDT